MINNIRKKMSKMNDYEFTMSFRIKWTPFKRCDECYKRKITSSLYEIHDNGLNAHIDAFVCLKCTREAKKRAKSKNEDD